MTKLLFLLSLLVVPMASFAQGGEKLNDLQTNATLHKKTLRNLDNGFIYLQDTIDLPIFDDFSTDQYAPYDAAIGQSNVQDTVQFLLWDLNNTNPIPQDSFALDTTFLYEYDTLSTSDSIVIIAQTPFPAMQLVEYDLCVYPFVFDTIDVWPPYNVFDSSAMVTGDVNDTLYLIEVEQDSATVYLVSPTLRDTGFVWIDAYTCRNSRYPINPPSVGVATFDGLDENGYPYDFTNVGNSYGEADYLTSKPINMGQYTAADSIYLSFYFQSTGLGNIPEEEDSLVLEYWVPSENDWEYVWSAVDTGFAVRDSFYYVLLKVDSTKYFADGFQFRFKNFASLSGNLDHWHIDYVYLKTFRSNIDTAFDDVAFVYESFGILNDYTAMPWKHYKWDPDNFTKDTTTLLIYNNNTVSKVVPATLGAQMYTKYNNVALDSVEYVTGGAANISARSQREVMYPEAGFIVDTTVNDTCATYQICHTIDISNTGFEFNDSVTYEQVFSNYYAYDDGSAEAAYGPFGTGAMCAQRFEVTQPDSIRSVMIHFAPSVNDVSQKLFRLTIWEDDGSGKPGTIIYQTEPLFGESPIYTGDKNGFYEYFLQDVMGNFTARLEVDGIYFVGWVQTDADVLNVGFDRNINNQDNIFYNVSGSWLNTGFEGSLMIRPVFVSDKDGFLSDNELEQEITFNIYPNPATGQLFIDTQDMYNTQLELMSISGSRIRIFENTPNSIDVSELSAGLYLIRLVDDNGNYSVKKFLKQ